MVDHEQGIDNLSCPLVPGGAFPRRVLPASVGDRIAAFAIGWLVGSPVATVL
jgi:hypothetical protein